MRASRAMAGLKKCCRCKEDKELDCFPIARRRADGRGSACRICQAKYSKEWAERNPERRRDLCRVYMKANHRRFKSQVGEGRRDGRLKRKYGISSLRLEEMKEEQDHCCLICRKKKRLVIDHDHKTGKIRGLLCIRCNQALGLFGDDMDGVKRAYRYLELAESRSHDSTVFTTGLCDGACS